MLGNLLFNGDFDLEFRPWRDTAELTLALGWSPWWVERGGDDPEWKLRRPVFRPVSAEDDPERVRVGQLAQNYHTAWGTHAGGLWQQVVVPSARELCFEAWGQAWSSETDQPRPSQNPTSVRMGIGVDPNGGTDPLAASVMWSTEKSAVDQWAHFELVFTAASPLVTLFLRSAPEWPKKKQHIFWDQASLHLVDELENLEFPPAEEQPVSFELLKTARADGQGAIRVRSAVDRTGIGLLVRAPAAVFPAERVAFGRDGAAYYWEFALPAEAVGACLLLFTADNYSRVLGWSWHELNIEEADLLDADLEQVPAKSNPAGREYKRTYVLLPPTADQAWAVAAMQGGFDARRTVGFSPDDAGVGGLAEKRVIAVNPHHWLPELTADWFEQHYAGVRFEPLVVSTPAELRQALRAWRD